MFFFNAIAIAIIFISSITLVELIILSQWFVIEDAPAFIGIAIADCEFVFA